MVALTFSAVILGTPLLVLSGPASHAVAGPARSPSPARPSAGQGPFAGTALARFQGGVGDAVNNLSPSTTLGPSTTLSPPTTVVVAATSTHTTLDPLVVKSSIPSTTTTRPPPTTTAPPTTTTTAPANRQTGIATWYAESPAGGCASPTLPRGTVLKVTDNATGASITCLVDDVEGDNPGRVVDLAPSEFSQMADLSQGVIEVTVAW